jgi:uncharacterized protein (DUF1330 family)
MSAYVIARIEVTDWDQYKKYIAASPAAIAKFGGKFVSRGGEKVTFEGPDETRRVVIIEFPSMDDAKAFYSSDEYTEARKLRAGAAEASLIAVEGLSG